jgi:hypothetical protein
MGLNSDLCGEMTASNGAAYSAVSLRERPANFTVTLKTEDRQNMPPPGLTQTSLKNAFPRCRAVSRENRATVSQTIYGYSPLLGLVRFSVS